MFSPGDLFQFIGFPKHEFVSTEFPDDPSPNLNQIVTVVQCFPILDDFRCLRLSIDENWWVQYQNQPDSEIAYWAFGFRLISRPDPEVLTERVPVNVNFKIEA